MIRGTSMSASSRPSVDTSTVDGQVAVTVLLPLGWIVLALGLVAWRFIFLPPDQFWDFIHPSNLKWLAYAGSLHLFILWWTRRPR